MNSANAAVSLQSQGGQILSGSSGTLGVTIPPPPPPPGPTSWDLTIVTTSPSTAYKFNINAVTNSSNINLMVDYGDGAVSNYVTDGVKSHVYATASTNICKFSGGFGSAGGNIRLGFTSGTTPTLVKNTGIIGGVTGLVNFAYTFYGCTGLSNAIPTDLFRYNTAVSTNGFYYTFSGCNKLTTIPVDLFRYNPLVSTYGFAYTFSGCTKLAGAIPTDLFRYNTLVSTSAFYYTFQNCYALTAIPTDLFRYNTLVSDYGFAYTFYGCLGLTGAIPTDLFRYNTLVGAHGFEATFWGCTALTTIPVDLFRYNPLVSTYGFYGTFQSTGVTTIPVDLFSYNPLVSDYGFYSTFYGCAGITSSIPNDLFRSNTLVSVHAFDSTFYGCTGLSGAIPTDLFRYNTLVSDFAFCYAFRSCRNLTGAIPTDFFRYNTLAGTSAFYYTFADCGNLTSLPNAFNAYNTNANSWGMCFRGCTNLVGDLSGWTWRKKILQYDSYNSKIRYSTSPGALANNVTNTFSMRMDNSSLSAADVSNILIDLVSSAATAGTLNVGGNTAVISNARPTTAGYQAVTNLRARSWTVTVN
jgi:hypothetical protein